MLSLVPQQYESFARRLHETTPSLSAPLLEAAVTSYDTLTLTLDTLTTLYRAVPRMSRQQFTDRFVRHLTRGARAPVTVSAPRLTCRASKTPDFPRRSPDFGNSSQISLIS